MIRVCFSNLLVPFKDARYIIQLILALNVFGEITSNLGKCNRMKGSKHRPGKVLPVIDVLNI